MKFRWGCLLFCRIFVIIFWFFLLKLFSFLFFNERKIKLLNSTFPNVALLNITILNIAILFGLKFFHLFFRLSFWSVSIGIKGRLWTYIIWFYFAKTFLWLPIAFIITIIEKIVIKSSWGLNFSPFNNHSIFFWCWINNTGSYDRLSKFWFFISFLFLFLNNFRLFFFCFFRLCFVLSRFLICFNLIIE